MEPQQVPTADDELVNVAGAAAILATTPRHVISLQVTGRIPVVHIGRLVRFRRGDLARFIERNRQAATA
jgi:hypothetical protein